MYILIYDSYNHFIIIIKVCYKSANMYFLLRENNMILSLAISKKELKVKIHVTYVYSLYIYYTSIIQVSMRITPNLDSDSH